MCLRQAENKEKMPIKVDIVFSYDHFIFNLEFHNCILYSYLLQELSLK